MTTKKYIYKVNEKEFIDTVECFGKAWKEEKAYAKEVHAPIYREIIEIRHDVYGHGGLFISDEYAEKKPEAIERFEETGV